MVAGGARPAVVVSVLEGSNGFQLMSRTGRILNVPRRSIQLLWKFLRPAEEGRTCSLQGCVDHACVRSMDGRWFCGSHVPRNQPILLPGEAVETAHEVLDGAFERCPHCKVQLAGNNWHLVGRMTVYTCTCDARWILLTAQGSADDGFNLTEDLLEAHGILEDEGCLSIDVHIGDVAVNTIARSFRELDRSNPIFAGIPLLRRSTCPTNSLMLIGMPSQERAAKEPEELPRPDDLKIGDEYEQQDSGLIFRVEAFSALEVRLLGENNQLLSLRMNVFREVYRKVVRKTATERLLEDDDIV